MRNLKRVKKNQVFNTYRDFMEYIGEPFLNVKQREAQLERVSCYFGFEQIDKTFKITAIYGEKKVKANLLILAKKEIPIFFSSNNTMYSNHVARVLLNILAKSKSNQINMSRIDLFSALGMVSGCYSELYKERDKDKRLNMIKSIGIEVDSKDLTTFVNNVYSFCDSILVRCLQGLEKQGLISFSRELAVINKLDDVNVIATLATNNEIGEIVRIEASELQKMGFKTLTDVYKKGFELEFYTNIEKELTNSCDFVKYFRYYKIKLNEPNAGFKLDGNTLQKEKRAINKKIFERLKENDKFFVVSDILLPLNNIVLIKNKSF